MSADNWGICPKCKQKKDLVIQSYKDDLAAKYGKVPADEFLAIQNQLAKLEKEPPFSEQTLREDYEIGTDKDGEFSVGYWCSCNVCKFSFEFKQKEYVQ